MIANILTPFQVTDHSPYSTEVEPVDVSTLTVSEMKLT